MLDRGAAAPESMMFIDPVDYRLTGKRPGCEHAPVAAVCRLEHVLVMIGVRAEHGADTGGIPEAYVAILACSRHCPVCGERHIRHPVVVGVDCRDLLKALAVPEANSAVERGGREVRTWGKANSPELVLMGRQATEHGSSRQ